MVWEHLRLKPLVRGHPQAEVAALKRSVMAGVSAMLAAVAILTPMILRLSPLSA